MRTIFIFLTSILICQISSSQEMKFIAGVVDSKIKHYISKDGKFENYSFYLILPTQDKVFTTVYVKSLGKIVGEFKAQPGDTISLFGEYREESSNSKTRRYLSVNSANSRNYRVTKQNIAKSHISTDFKTTNKKASAGNSKSEKLTPKPRFETISERDADRSAKLYEKSLASARQAEARMSLILLYTSQRSYGVEFQSFTSDLVATGFSIQAKAPFYFCGFSKPFNDTNKDVQNYDPNRINSEFVSINLPTNINKLKSAIPTDAVVSKDSFKAACVGNIDNDETLDVWTIDERKNLIKVVDDAIN